MCRECEPQEEQTKKEEAICGCGCLGFKRQESKTKNVKQNSNER